MISIKFHYINLINRAPNICTEKMALSPFEMVTKWNKAHSVDACASHTIWWNPRQIINNYNSFYFFLNFPPVILCNISFEYYFLFWSSISTGYLCVFCFFLNWLLSVCYFENKTLLHFTGALWLKRMFEWKWMRPLMHAYSVKSVKYRNVTRLQSAFWWRMSTLSHVRWTCWMLHYVSFSELSFQRH